MQEPHTVCIMHTILVLRTMHAMHAIHARHTPVRTVHILHTIRTHPALSQCTPRQQAPGTARYPCCMCAGVV